MDEQETPLCAGCLMVFTPGVPVFHDGPDIDLHFWCALDDLREQLQRLVDFAGSSEFSLGFDPAGLRDMSLGQLILWHERVQQEKQK